MKTNTDAELLDRRVATAFYGRFPSLRPMQEAVISPLINQENLILASGTGSGKTEAIMAPLVSLHWRQAVQADVLVILYIAPTKALVNDLEKRLTPLLSPLGFRVGVRHSDRDDLKRAEKPHILITTPESLEVILMRKDQSLENIKCLVIDEVHLLYNTQRGLQLSVLITRLQQCLSHQLQCVALSATIGDFNGIKKFFFPPQSLVKVLSFPISRPIESHIHWIQEKKELLSFIQKLLTGRNKTKFLIFVNSRKECERVADILKEDKSLAPRIFTHYSSLSKEVRIEVEQKFSTSSQNSICVATNTLELGIDIGDIDAVILWDTPYRLDSFLQRIGRSNRRENKTNVICLITDQSTNPILDCLLFMAFIDAAKRGELPSHSPYELFGAINQQCFSFIASREGRYTKTTEFLDFFKIQSYIDRQILEDILNVSAEQEYLIKHGFKNQYGAGKNLYWLKDQRLIYGNFAPGSRMIEIKHSSKVLGEVPVENLLNLNTNTVIKFAGTQWKIKSLSRNHIEVVPCKNDNNAIDLFYASSSSLVVETFICNHIWRMIHADDLQMDNIKKDLRNDISSLISLLREKCRYDQVPLSIKNLSREYYTFAGFLVNQAIAIVLNLKDVKVDNISISTSTEIQWDLLPDNPMDYEQFFKRLFKKQQGLSIYQELLPANLKQVEATQIWLKDQTIKTVLQRLSSASNCEVSLFHAF